MSNLMVITGASSGIGEALAAQAAATGHTIATISRRPGPGEHLAADLSDPGSWSMVAEWVDALIGRQPWDRIVFVHNAGALEPIGFAGEVDSDAYVKNILLNSASPQVLGDRFITAAERAGVSAQFQLISSGAGKRPFLGWSSYCAGKAAGDMWIRTAGLERIERNSKVLVVSVGPGVVDTDMQGHIREQSDDTFPMVAQFQGLSEGGQLAPKDDVARILLALAECNEGDTLGDVTIENGLVTDVAALS
ncbi:MAG: benzil reductase ((S)-benzoin forming) [Verrucomicrobiales bacterium]|jgi:benzil reductase ((S)-benzoin forming)